MAETQDLATDLVLLALERRGCGCVRLNQDLLDESMIAWDPITGLVSADTGTHLIGGADMRAVWYRRLSVPGGDDWQSAFIARQWAAVVGGFVSDVGSMNDPSAVAVAQNKLVQLQAAARAGLTIPRTLVTNSTAMAREFVRDVPSVVKAVVSGGGVDGDGKWFVLPTVPVAEEDLTEQALRAAPAILQQRVDARSHIRVTVIDQVVLAARIRVTDPEPEDLDWRMVDDGRLSYESFDCSPDLADALRSYVGGLGLRFGAIDLIESADGHLVFLEVNPGGQWGWLEAHLDLPITAAVVSALLGDPAS